MLYFPHCLSNFELIVIIINIVMTILNAPVVIVIRSFLGAIRNVG